MKKSSKPIPAIDTRRQCNCGECLMEHVDIVPLRENGTCPCCELAHQCQLNSQFQPVKPLADRRA